MISRVVDSKLMNGIVFWAHIQLLNVIRLWSYMATVRKSSLILIG
jgi:hypothetical protein